MLFNIILLFSKFCSYSHDGTLFFPDMVILHSLIFVNLMKTIKLKYAGRHTILLFCLQENSYHVSIANSCKVLIIECEM